MKKAVFVFLAMAVLSLSGAFAQEVPAPVAPEPEVAVEAPAAPTEALKPELALPTDTLIFLDAVDDAAYNVCCQTANASCQASCTANVRRFECTRVGARGCTSSCTCF